MEDKAPQSQRRRPILRSTSSKSRTNRKPFSDLTNTLSKSHSQSQSSPATVTKPKPKPYFQPKTKPNPNPATTTSATGSTSTADPSTPLPPPRPSAPPGGDDNVNDDVFEIHTVYTRKQTANKRKGKEKTLAVPFRSYSADRVANAGHKRNEHKDMGLEPRTLPRKKQRRAKLEQETSSHALQDYIEQQRAYFNEIDAFELPEEEVGSGNESD